mgnify:FL=1
MASKLAPGGVENGPGDPGDRFKITFENFKIFIFLKIYIFQNLIYFIIWARFRHIWTPDSNSALKIIRGYGFKPGFGRFSINFSFLGPRGPCDYEF